MLLYEDREHDADNAESPSNRWSTSDNLFYCEKFNILEKKNQDTVGKIKWKGKIPSNGYGYMWVYTVKA